MKDNWKDKLNPFDAELCIMVESLTGQPCELKNGGNHYYFEFDYRKHNTPEYISAICGAIEGRAGKRLISFKDNPDAQRMCVRIRFHKEDYPRIIYQDGCFNENPDAGKRYCKRMSEIRALQVERANAEALFEFVGNGEMEIERTVGVKVTFHFLNGSGSVYDHAPEHSYIVYVKPGLFDVVDKETFEREYEPK